MLRMVVTRGERLTSLKDNERTQIRLVQMLPVPQMDPATLFEGVLRLVWGSGGPRRPLEQRRLNASATSAKSENTLSVGAGALPTT